MDENVLPFQSKKNDKNTPEDTASSTIDDLKSTLNQRLKEKHEQERRDDIQTQKTTEKLLTGLFSALSLSKKNTADLAATHEKNHQLLQDNEQLAKQYEQLKTHNQQLQHENTALKIEQDIANKNIRNLDNLSTDLSRAIRTLEARCTELAIKLGQSSAGQAQLRKALSDQAFTVTDITHTNHALEKNNAALADKVNLLKSIFNQGQSLLNTLEPEPVTQTHRTKKSTSTD